MVDMWVGLSFNLLLDRRRKDDLENVLEGPDF